MFRKLGQIFKKLRILYTKAVEKHQIQEFPSNPNLKINIESGIVSYDRGNNRLKDDLTQFLKTDN